jgi:hypothetical protein
MSPSVIARLYMGASCGDDVFAGVPATTGGAAGRADAAATFYMRSKSLANRVGCAADLPTDTPDWRTLSGALRALPTPPTTIYRCPLHSPSGQTGSSQPTACLSRRDRSSTI